MGVVQIKPQIISASRRTDIPAFYSEWFINRIRQEWGVRYNPYNGKTLSISLKADHVGAIVFWSKNYLPLIPYLDELDKKNYNLVFHFTITGLPSCLENNVPPSEQTLKTFKYLAGRYSPDHVLWRYDPILLTETTDYNFHLKTFSYLCSELERYTRRCYISFVNLYGKVEKRLYNNDVTINNDAYQSKIELANFMADISLEHGINLYSCCNEFLLNEKVKKARCIDAELLRELYRIDISSYSVSPSRKKCGCYKSIDLGLYDTCLHQCLYCYANNRKERIKKNYEHHDPFYPALHKGIDITKYSQHEIGDDYEQISLKF